MRFFCLSHTVSQVVLFNTLSLAEVQNIPAAVGIPVSVQSLLHWAAMCPVHPSRVFCLFFLWDKESQ